MGAKLLEDSSTPLYQQVANHLKTTIENGIYRVGQKIPPEPELSQLYSVSRITVRKAIELLVEDGLLSKRQGKGTFVNEAEEGPSSFQNDDIVQSFSVTCEANGVVPGAVLVTRELAPLPDGGAAFFGGACDGRAVRVKRVRTADGRPLMVEDNYFDPERYQFLLESDLDGCSIFRLIEEHCGLVPRNSDSCVLSMERADIELAGLLQVPENEPLFSVRGEYLDQYGNPMFLGIQHVVGKHYSFRL